MSNNNDNSERNDCATTSETIHHRWDAGEQPSLAIVEAVAVATNRKPTELPPLQRVVDVDALEALLTGESDVQISFQYEQTGVCIGSEGGIELQVHD
jgi:hypothetical protein